MIEASKKLNFVIQDSQNVTLPSEYSSRHNRHETKIFLISSGCYCNFTLRWNKGIFEFKSSNILRDSCARCCDTRCCCTMGIIHIFDGTLR